jgi:hypothetical protein
MQCFSAAPIVSARLEIGQNVQIVLKRKFFEMTFWRQQFHRCPVCLFSKPILIANFDADNVLQMEIDHRFVPKMGARAHDALHYLRDNVAARFCVHG